MAESPSAVKGESFRPSVQRSGAKRPREDLVELHPQEVMDTLEVTDDYMVLGIDEAGRGPVIGPMVYSGAMITLKEHDDLIKFCHVADSKQLSAEARDEALQSFSKLKTLKTFTIVLTPDDIAKAMLGRHGQTLNTISHEAAIKIIVQATLEAAGKLCAVYVDTVGPPESYQSRLSGRFPHLRCVVSKKADSKYPPVSAASIVAKTTRDDMVAKLGLDVGSGYPSDPGAVRFIKSHLHRFFVYERRYDCVRQSWGPVIKLASDPSVCIQVEFEQDLENENKKKGLEVQPNQMKLSFAPKRNAVYSHILKLQTVSQLNN